MVEKNDQVGIFIYIYNIIYMKTIVYFIVYFIVYIISYFSIKLKLYGLMIYNILFKEDKKILGELDIKSDKLNTIKKDFELDMLKELYIINDKLNMISLELEMLKENIS